MQISASLVKELRSKTGAGIMDAKTALMEKEGNVEEAIDWLRTKGMAKAAKKSGRATAEGQVAIVVRNGVGVAVEVNSETDFVAKNKEFCGFARKVAEVALEADNLDSLKESELDDGTVGTVLAKTIATLGENMSVRRMKKVSGKSVASYVHNKAEEGIGKIGVLVALDGDDDGIGRKVAMHVAATSPISISEEDAPAERVERERQVLTEIAKNSGKPAGIIDKIVSGGLKKFFATETLLNQKFVLDPNVTVGEALEASNVRIKEFALFKVGESMD